MNVIELKKLGDTYEEQGDYESAELIYRRALAIQEKELGEEHPTLSVDLYNLGLLCYAMQRYTEAEVFLMRAWAIERTHFGPMHHETLATLEALSELYYDANRNVEVEYRGIAAGSTRMPQHAAVHMYH